MKKSFKLKNIDCANCAGIIEEKISKLDGVNDAKINLAFGKFKIDMDDEKSEEILDEAMRIFDEVEPGSSFIR